MLKHRTFWFAAAMACGLVPAATAQQAGPDLVRASLEDLMNMQITSAGRKEQRAADVAAAVYVITQEQIRRSGATLVPELLRLAPGVQVARLDASKWAISIRGFNQRWSDKLLVLVDGRTVYTRLFSGVYWDTLNLFAADIDRIEVVRGPGASVWGSNAVDGVINIITKTAGETKGVVASAAVGSQGESTTGVRYGGEAGGAAYRADLQWQRHGHMLLDPTTPAPDEWSTVTGGFRLDRARASDRLTVQGQLTRAAGGLLGMLPEGPVAPANGWPPLEQRFATVRGYGLVRWSRTPAARGTLDLQAFVDTTDRDELGGQNRATTVDGEIRYHGVAAKRHDFVAGTGYRRTADRLDGTFFVSLMPERETLNVFNAFVQDEIRLRRDRVRVTVGAKVEHETYTGWGLQPTARVMWAPTGQQRVWAAVSQAVRTPSRVNRGLRFNSQSMPGEAGLPVVVSVFGNADYRAERITSVEAGYRVDRAAWALDLTTYAARHADLQTLEGFAPYVETTYGLPNVVVGTRLGNGMRADTHGVELSGRWRPVRWWHVDGSYTWFHFQSRFATTSTDFRTGLDGDAPAHQWQIRHALSFGQALDVDLAIGRTGRLGNLQVPAYTRGDARVEWHVSRDWALALTGQNLIGAAHREFGGFETATTIALDPRRVTIGATWRR